MVGDVMRLLRRFRMTLEDQQDQDPSLDLFRLWVHPDGGVSILPPGRLPPDGFRGDVVEVLARCREEARETYWRAQAIPEAEPDPVEKQKTKRARMRLRRIDRWT